MGKEGREGDLTKFGTLPRSMDSIIITTIVSLIIGSEVRKNSGIRSDLS